MIEFNGMSTHLGLSFVKKLEKCVHFMFIFTFLCVFFAHWHIKNWSIWPLEGTLTGAITQDQSGAESNGNEEVTPELELHYQMQFNIIPGYKDVFSNIVKIIWLEWKKNEN